MEMYADFLDHTAISNPRKAIKNAERPLGNLPLEILTYLSAYLEEISATGQMKSTVLQSQYSKFWLLAVRSLADFDSECSCWFDRYDWQRRTRTDHTSPNRLQYPHFPGSPYIRLLASIPTSFATPLDHNSRYRGCGLHHVSDCVIAHFI